MAAQLAIGDMTRVEVGKPIVRIYDVRPTACAALSPLEPKTLAAPWYSRNGPQAAVEQDA